MTILFQNQMLLFNLVLILFGVGALGSLVFNKYNDIANYAGGVFAGLGSIAGMLLGLSVILSGQAWSVNFATSLPALSFSFNFDLLSSFFVCVISFIGFLASVYSLGYVKHFYNKYNIGFLSFFYNIFLLSMIFVVTASHLLFFLIVWELMSLSSYFLVVYDRKDADNIKAGTLYFIMMHIGTAFIVTAFMLIYGATGSFDFAVIRAGAGAISSWTKTIIFISALIGFGVKAGIIPLHIWLPQAHPAAPSHVSALMSSVMIKTGIYMMIRIFFDLLPGAPMWWGLLILIIGAVSSVLGVLYALAEHDIKKLLAYHSIENIGIILLGVGSALAFKSSGMMYLALLALGAGLFHTLNHATFKALLFMGAGSVISGTHTRNIEEMGGLVKIMPYTSVFFLVGCLAISGIPPFNGFFSEWVTFQALFFGIGSVSIAFKLVSALAAGSLAITGGLAAACFVKAFGSTFLALPRSDEAKHAREADTFQLTGMGVLALATLVIGVSSGFVTNIIEKIVLTVQGFTGVESVVSAGLTSVVVGDKFASLSLWNLFLLSILVLIVVSALVYGLTRKNKTTRNITWGCGTPTNSRMEITSTGFARSLVIIFGEILKPTKQSDIEYSDAHMRYFPKYSMITMGTKDVYSSAYAHFNSAVTKISGYVKTIQSGNINMYVLYILIVLVGLLLLLLI